jgi:hypothetical protein
MFADRTQETSTSTGTGNFTLAGTETGYQRFIDAVGTSGTFPYVIEHNSANEWEVGYGQIINTGNVLQRLSVLSSSNTGALINFSSGNKDVYLCYTADNAHNVVNDNLIWNGNFDIWQENTTFTASTGAATWTADGWIIGNTSAAVATVSRSTDVPTLAQSDCLSNYSMLVDCTTADVALATGDAFEVNCAIEGYDFQQIAQQPFTLSFWVKATKVGTYCVALRNNGSDRSYIKEYTVNQTATWEKKVIVFPATTSAGTWDYTNGVGLRVTWTLLNGSSYQTTPNIWATGDFRSTSNQVNGMDSTSNDFRLAQVKIERGQVPTRFVPVPFSDLMQKARRYYETSYYYGQVVPTAGTSTAEGYHVATIQNNTFANQLTYGTIVYCVSKRTTPTIIVYPYVTPTNTGRVTDGNLIGDETALSGDTLIAGEQICVIYNNTGLTLSTTGGVFFFAWVSHARLW